MNKAKGTNPTRGAAELWKFYNYSLVLINLLT